MKKFICIIMSFMFIFGFSACSSKSFDWDDMVLGGKIPEPPATKGEIHNNSADNLYIDILKISNKEFNNYVEVCKANGFSTDIKTTSASFEAHNTEGYKLRLSYYSTNSEMSIDLEKPIEMSPITWPVGIAGKQIPPPKSTIGNFVFEYDDNFYLYVGNTTKAEYTEYVKNCSEYGFNVDYDKDDNYYRADNTEGWHLSLCYEGFNIISINIDAPKENKNSNPTVSNTNPSTSTNTPTYNTTTVNAKEDTTKPKSKYEKAYIRDMNNYDLYCMFDTDNNSVVSFGTYDTYIDEGTYTGELSSGVTIVWSHGEWVDKFTHNSENCYLTDGNGWKWEYKPCEVEDAEKILNDLR